MTATIMALSAVMVSVYLSGVLVCGVLSLGVVLDVSKGLRASIIMGQAVQK
jgi:hypothetical protein